MGSHNSQAGEGGLQPRPCWVGGSKYRGLAGLPLQAGQDGPRCHSTVQAGTRAALLRDAERRPGDGQSLWGRQPSSLHTDPLAMRGGWVSELTFKGQRGRQTASWPRPVPWVPWWNSVTCHCCPRAHQMTSSGHQSSSAPPTQAGPGYKAVLERGMMPAPVLTAVPCKHETRRQQ